MARPSSANPKDRQILARVTAAEYEVLDAVAHLERSTVNALVRRLVEAEVRRMENDPNVIADVENRADYERRREGSVHQLRPRSTSR